MIEMYNWTNWGGKMAKHQQKRKLRLGRVILAIIIVFLVITVIAGIVFYSKYKSSLNEAEKENSLKSFTFNGVKSGNGDFNVLLLGSDSRGKDQGRSDTIMIARYDKKTRTPKLVSIMRDTYVDIPGHGKNKINAAYSFGGPELVRKTIKENFNVDIQYYVVANFSQFPKIVDALAPNGIEINAEKNMSKNIDVHIKAGKQKMNGKTLLQYARFRHDSEGDFGRIRRQQQVLTALKKQAVKAGSITKLPDVLGKLQGYTSTDMPSNLLFKTGIDFALGKTKDLEKFSIPSKGLWHGERIDGVGDVLRMDDVAANAKKLQAFLNK